MIDETKQKLIDRVIGQIELDLENRDVTAIFELLDKLSVSVLESYLSEVE
jgi:hypothetical protein